MKNVFVLAAMCAAFVSASAQEVTPPLQNSKLADNWFVSVNGGVITPLKHSNGFFKSMRPTLGVEVGRYLTPVFGLAVEDRIAFNTTGAKTAIDQNHLVVLTKWNLSNWIAGYPGEPRTFEVVGVAGMGWAHNFGLPKEAWKNALTAKVGMEFNYNLGQDKKWQLNLKPGIVWGGKGLQRTKAKLNANEAAFELNIGVTYKFGNSYGKHNFTPVREYDAAEVANLNSRIDALLADNSAKDKEINQKNQTISDLQTALDECNKREPVTVTKNVEITTNTKSLESVVTFGQGKSNVDASQLPNVERIATFMKNHKNSTVSIKGYASPEGNADLNAKLATKRAEAVKNVLINKYKIAADRIQAEGQGVGDMFSEPDWNRVAISTIAE